jgi:hypothetical protein
MFDERAFVFMPFKIGISYKVKKRHPVSRTPLSSFSLDPIKFVDVPCSPSQPE